MTSNLGNQSGRGRLPVQARDRRPALAALALLLIVAGGLGAGLIVYRTGRQTDVLVANKTITPGHRMVSTDFTQDRVSGASNRTIAASAESNFIGTTAVTTIPSGSLLIKNMFTGGSIVPSNGQLVGLYLSVAQRTDTAVSPGSVVQIYQVQKSGQSVSTQATPLGNPVLVYQTHTAAGDGSLHIDVLVANSDPDLKTIVSSAAKNELAITQLSLDTKPELDLTSK